MDDEVKCNEVYNLEPEIKHHTEFETEFEDEVLREVKKWIQNKQDKHTMIHETQCNEQESMVDNMDNADKMKFSISYSNNFQLALDEIAHELSIIKALLKNDPSDDISKDPA